MEESKSVPGARKVRKPSSGGRSSRKSSHSSVASLTDSEIPETSESTGSDNLGLPKNNLPNGTHLDGDRVSEQSGAKEKNKKESTVATSKDNEETAEQNGTSKKEGNSKSYETISDISEDIKIIQSSSREVSAKRGGNDSEKGDKDLVNTTNKSESETKKKKHKVPKKEEKGDENKVIKKKIIKKKVVKENEKNIGGNVNVNIVDKETKKTESGKDVKESEKENSLELNIGYKSEKSGSEQKVKERPRKQSTETKPKVKEGGSKKSGEHKKKIVKEDNSSSGEEQSKSYKKNESDSSSDDGSTSKLDFAGFDNPNNEKSTMFFRILDDIRIDDSVMEDITGGETENETEKKEDDLNTSDVFMEDDRTDQEDDYDYDGSDDIFAPEVVCVPMSGDVPYQFGKDDLSTTSSTPSLSSIFGGGSSRKRTRDRGGIKKPPVDLSSPQFLKPFEYGWKRELVFRSVSDIGTSKRNADIYYYTPKGKKVRSTREVIENLTDVELTIDNFTFFKEPIGVNDPEKEIIREAKVRAERDHSSTPPPAKKPSLPKTPKGEKAAKVMSPSHSNLSPEHTTSPPKVGIANFSATPKIVLKPVKIPSAKNKSSSKPVFTPPSKSSSSKDKRGHRDSEDELEMGMLPPLWPTPPEKGTAREISPSTKVPGTSKTIEVCSIRCPLAMGLIPTLQCHLCLCLYHPECVGIEEAINRTIHSYVCKNCQEAKKGGGISGPVLNKVTPPVLTTPPPLTPISNLGINSNASQSSPASSPPKLQRLLTDKLPTTSKSQKIVGGVTTWLPPSSMIQLTSKNTSSKASVPAVPTVESASALGSMPAQTLMSMNGKRYVVVPKHNVLSVSPAITTSGVSVSDPHSPGSTFVSCNSTTNDTTVSSSSVSNTLIATTNPVLPSVSIIPNTLTTNSNASISLLPPIVNPGDPSSRAFIMNNPTTPTNPAGVLLVPCVTTTASNSKDCSKFVIVNGPSGIPTGNFIIGNIPPQQQLQLPAVPTTQPAIPSNEPASGIKRTNDDNDKIPSAKRAKKESTSGSSFSSSTSTPKAANTALPHDAATPLSDISGNSPSFDKDYVMTNVTAIYHALIHSFQYLKVQELLGASRVCRLWRDIAHHKSLWQTVRMKNSRVRDWEGFASMLRYSGTKHLDLRKMLVPDKPESLCEMWSEYARAIERVNHLLRIDMCRCPASAIEITVRNNPGLQVFSALSIKCSVLDLKPFENCKNLTELRLKTTDKTGMNVENLSVLSSLTRLKHLSLPSMKTIPVELAEVLQNLANLESLELGDCATLDEKVAVEGFPKLLKLKRLRLEKSGSSTPTIPLLYSISDLPCLTQLELINFDIKPGFDSALSLCTNLRTLLIIPTYVTQSATTNHVVMEGVSKLSKTLMHFVWGITLELLKVTDLFIDQWEGQKGPMKSPPSSSSSTNSTPKKGTGDSIPILKPLTDETSKEGGNTPSQVDILQLPKLHRVLTTLLPTTKIKILKVPFAATWRQTVTGPSNPQ